MPSKRIPITVSSFKDPETREIYLKFITSERDYASAASQFSALRKALRSAYYDSRNPGKLRHFVTDNFNEIADEKSLNFKLDKSVSMDSARDEDLTKTFKSERTRMDTELVRRMEESARKMAEVARKMEELEIDKQTIANTRRNSQLNAYGD